MEKNLKSSKVMISCVLISLLVMMTACGSKKADLNLQELQGTWVQTMSDGTQTMILKSDMTYTEIINITSEPPMSMEASDTYSVDGNKLIINYSDYDTQSEYTVEINGNKMIWDTGETTIEYTRQ